jgi:4-oxalocrotonate tautomerase
MPLIQVTMLEGRTVEQKHQLIRQLTDAMINVVGGDPARVRVALYEVSSDEWGIGGEPVSKVRPSG